MTTVIYHNPRCSNSRTVLAMIRDAGVEPEVVEYLKASFDRATLADLMHRMGVPPRALLREKEAIYGQLGLGDPAVSDDQLIGAMVAHPILINRPIVVTKLGARLCRPPERVLDLLPSGS